MKIKVNDINKIEVETSIHRRRRRRRRHRKWVKIKDMVEGDDKKE